eukprot:gene16970-8471_t
MTSSSEYDKYQQNEKLREDCSNGYSHEVLKGIEEGAEVNSRNKVNGWTALHWAAKRNHDNIVIILLKHGANANIKNIKGELPVDLTSREDIKRLLTADIQNVLQGRREQEKSECGEGREAQSGDSVKSSAPGAVSFVPGYLANPVFPYAVATGNPIITQAVDRGVSKSEQSVLVPGYIANPVIMTARASSVTVDSKENSSEEKKVEPPLLVPGYIANPVIPYAVATGNQMADDNTSKNSQEAGNENPVNFQVAGDFKQMFVPHVQQLGSLVNTYVNSMKSLEKPVEYRLYNSCKTTPVATVFMSTPVSELVLKVRVAGADDFIEVELNNKLLTYEELLNVCCKELNINRSQISKLRKLPNTIIRRDKDVKRLHPLQELEVLLL